MTEQERNQAIKMKRLPANWEFWSTSVFCSALWSFFVYVLTDFFLTSLGANALLKVLYAVLVCGFFFWIYWRNNRLRIIKNKYKKSTNYSKVRHSLKSLGWEHSSSQNVIYVGYNKLYLKFLEIKIIPIENGVLYNFQYIENRGFRFPFFIGLRTYARKKFEKSLLFTS